MPLPTKQWVIPTSEFALETISQEGVHPIIGRILTKRGIIGQDAIRHFLHPDYDRDVHDPFLFDDMTRAVDRIGQALDRNELIVIHGDYDADGVCGSTLLYELLTLLGANVDVYIPHREKEGYGLRMPTVDKLKARDAKVIITVDCGIACTDEIAYANTLGIDTIITDHHTEPTDPERMPKAHAIIHPRVHADNYPFDFLAGVGSAFKFSQGLIHTDNPVLVKFRSAAQDPLGNSINWDAYEKWQLDLVSIATITDCMPLVGENRALVHYGFIVLEKTIRKGLRSLMNQAGVSSQKPSSKMIGFDIGPRINAAGRIEHAQLAFDLMTSKTLETAEDLASQIEATNIRRRKISQRIVEEAEEAVQPDLEAGSPILCAYNPEWPLGVLGLVAGRLANKYGRPVILCMEKDGRVEGTSRTIPGLSILEALNRVADLLHHYGGHAAAAGLCLAETTEFDVFRTTIAGHIKDMITTSTGPSIEADATVALSDITWELAHGLQLLEPFGQGNTKPILHIPNVTVETITTMGKTAQHVRCVFSQGVTKRRAVGFSFAESTADLDSGDTVDVLCELDINEWNGNQELQLTLLDIKQVV